MPDLYDVVDETCGEGTANIELTEEQKQKLPPTRTQISNLSLPKEKSQIGGACSNLVNSVVGAGIIGIPYALKESGLVAGVILLVLVSFFTDRTLRMLVELAHFHPKLKAIDVLTFEDLISLPFGEIGGHFILASMLFVAYGAMVAYLLIIKDTVPIIIGFSDDPGAGGFMQSELVMVVASLVVIVPLSMQRDMSSLAYTSALSVMADIVLVGIIAMFSPYQETVANNGGIVAIMKDDVIGYGFFIGFGVLTTAMTCQHSAFIVSGSLQGLSTKRWSIVTMLSMVAACFLCAILGITGYLGFLDETKGDVLNNFDYEAREGTVARCLLALTMFFTYPMEAFVARHVIMKLLYDGDMDGDTVSDNSSFLGSLSNRRVKWTWILYLATLIPALIVDDLGPVLSITGALGGCCLAYIGPGLVYLGINGDFFLEYVGSVLDGSNPSTPPDASTDDDGAYTNMAVDPSSTAQRLSGPKPWWWYPLLMPLWVRIASHGSNGMQERLAGLAAQHRLSLNNEDYLGTETVIPTKRDYFLSIFFIVFGTISLIAGLLSNFVAYVM
ncbi:unnamed protein product [Cylindrotheca closterium]|uniref:Amino acid transporter transmembrane domain-containing protein n=1 Tax=Cylindrotheca closterium TaxID=2856 RepID=A0AAD2CGQ5_9STRA|nr:unnamed protein product [Cylindrotheca closterium]